MSTLSLLKSVQIEWLESRRLLAQTPFHGTPFEVATSGTTTIQAEDFDNGGEGVAYHDVDAANLGGKYRTTGVDIGTTTDIGGGFYVSNVKAGEWLEYTLHAAQEGSYNLLSRVAGIGTGGAWHVEINGVQVDFTNGSPDTGGWQSWTTNANFINLPAGTSIMRISMDANSSRGSVGNFNYFQISAAGPVQPPGQSPYLRAPIDIAASGSSRVFVSLFDNGGEGAAYHDVDAVNSGKRFRVAGVDIQVTSDPSTGYNLGYTKAGEWLEYTINVEKSGAYATDFHLANTGSGGKFHVEIDGSNVTGSITMPNTGGFQTWTTVSGPTVNLAAGQHVLRLKMDANSGNGSVGNFTWIQFSPAGEGTTTLTNTVASTVRDGAFADQNFGSDRNLIVKNSTLDYNREAWLKFDLSSITSVGSARLRLFGSLTDASSAKIQLWTARDPWDENTITWNNKPAELFAVGDGLVSGTAPQWYEIDVTSYIRGVKSDGLSTATLVVRSQTFSSAPQVVFNSDDAAGNQPQLVATS